MDYKPKFQIIIGFFFESLYYNFNLYLPPKRFFNFLKNRVPHYFWLCGIFKIINGSKLG